MSRARVRREVTLPPCQAGQCPAFVLALDLLPDIGYVGHILLSRHKYTGLLSVRRQGYAGPGPPTYLTRPGHVCRILLPAHHRYVKNSDMGMSVRICSLLLAFTLPGGSPPTLVAEAGVALQPRMKGCISFTKTTAWHQPPTQLCRADQSHRTAYAGCHTAGPTSPCRPDKKIPACLLRHTVKSSNMAILV